MAEAVVNFYQADLTLEAGRAGGGGRGSDRRQFGRADGAAGVAREMRERAGIAPVSAVVMCPETSAGDEDE